jgi:hypothetical protein
MYQSTKFDVRQTNLLKKLSSHYAQFDLWLYDLFLRCTSLSSLMSVKQRVLQILSSHYIFMSILTLDFWTSKSIGVIHSLGYTRVPSFMSVKQRVFKILSGQYIQCKLTIEFWSHDLNISLPPTHTWNIIMSTKQHTNPQTYGSTIRPSQFNLVDYHPGSPKNIGWVGGFYFIIFISLKKNYWWQFCVY